MVSLGSLRTKHDGWGGSLQIDQHFFAYAANSDKENEGCRMWAQYLREYKPTIEGRLFKYDQKTGKYDSVYDSDYDVARFVEVSLEYGAIATHFAKPPYFADDVAILRRAALMAVLPPIEALQQLGPWFSYQDTDRLRGKINSEATLLYNFEKRVMAPIVYGLTIMLCDGYLKPCKLYRVWPLAPKANDVRRFWCIVQRLPIELQAVVAQRIDGKDGVIVPMSHFIWQAVGAMTAIAPK